MLYNVGVNYIVTEHLARSKMGSLDSFGKLEHGGVRAIGWLDLSVGPNCSPPAAGWLLFLGCLVVFVLITVIIVIINETNQFIISVVVVVFFFVCCYVCPPFGIVIRIIIVYTV